LGEDEKRSDKAGLRGANAAKVCIEEGGAV